MRHFRAIIGFLLVIAAISALIFWEARGRDLVFQKNLVVAAAEINAGDYFTESNLEIRGINSGDIIDGALDSSMMSALLGMRAEQYIPTGSQINEYFVSADDSRFLEPGESIFCIGQDDISMVSSSLRKGDMVQLYGESGRLPLGTYKVAFVKDGAGREVKNAEQLRNNIPLDREDSNYTINSIEIICSQPDYVMLNDYLSDSGCGLTVVQVLTDEADESLYEGEYEYEDEYGEYAEDNSY